MHINYWIYFRTSEVLVLFKEVPLSLENIFMAFLKLGGCGFTWFTFSICVRCIHTHNCHMELHDAKMHPPAALQTASICLHIYIDHMKCEENV